MVTFKLVVSVLLFLSIAAGNSACAKAMSNSQSTAADRTLLAPIVLNSSPKAANETSTPEVAQADEPGSKNVVIHIEPPSIAGKASIGGRVTDKLADQPVAGVRVVIIKTDEEHRRYHTETNKDGKFIFKNIDPGDWKVTFSHNDMLSHNETVSVSAGEAKPLKVAMEDLEPVDVLRITGKRTLIHPERIGSTTNLGHQFINEYRSGNNLRQLIESTPGVITDTYGNIITRGEHNAINYEIDGVILPEAAGVLQQSQPATPRSLQSMQVDIGGYEAHDGGGPLGAVVRMKSLPIHAKPKLLVGGQLGGPLAGSLYYNATGAFSQNPKSRWNRLRFESSGAFVASSYRLAPPVQVFTYNNGLDINSLTKIEYRHDERNTFRLTAGINESFLQVPISKLSKSFNVRERQHDRQDYIIATYKRIGGRLYDELSLSLINAFYYEGYRSNGQAFDPNPIVNGEEEFINSVQAQAKRFNYAFNAQGTLKKLAYKTHHLEAGFLSEARPVRTKFGAVYRNANLEATASAMGEAQEEINAAIAAGENPSGINPNPLPYAAVISPFTMAVGGPAMTGQIGTFKGFRYLQSGYFQDTWKPREGFLRRLTVNAGVRADVYHGVFGNTLAVASTLATIPGIEPFSLQPFQRQTVTDAQASGRFGGTFVLTPTTVIRGSFSNIFTPPPVDVFVTPPLVEEGAVDGIFPGTVRPLRATRGNLVDTSVEQQIGSRFVTRTNLFYKKLSNFGDSGVIQNTPIYNRLQLSGQEAYGIESRIDLKPKRDGTGFNGFASNTIQVAYLRGSRQVTGGVYDFETEGKYPDHDRRYSLAAGLGYKSKRGWWMLGDVQVLSGLPNRLNPEIFGPHPKRTPRITLLGLSTGYQTPRSLRKSQLVPSGFDVRIENMLNERKPTNLGSPFQGTRFLIPFRLLAGLSWQV